MYPNEDYFNNDTKDIKNEVFSTSERDKLLPYLWKNSKDPQCLMFLLMYVTGMRIGEATTLKHSDIQDNVITIKRSASGSFRDSSGKIRQTRVKNDGEAKTKKSLRDITIPEGADAILDMVKALNPDSEFIFTNSNGQVFTRSAMNHKLDRICNKLGIEHKSTHGFRKTYLSILDDNQVSSATIIALAGHTDFSITETHYIKNTHNIIDIRDRLKSVKELDFTAFSG